MKKYFKFLTSLLVIVAIASIPAIVSAYYVPADDDNLPDSYSLVKGSVTSGDLEDVVYDDGDNITIASQRIWYRQDYIEIHFHFEYDFFLPDCDGINIEFNIIGESSNTMVISVYGDEDGWITLGTITDSVNYIGLGKKFVTEIIEHLFWYSNSWNNFGFGMYGKFPAK